MAGRKAETTAEKARRMVPLKREEVVGAALELLDEDGLDGLTTRRLAGRLGVRVGALYWHVESKQELLAAVADRFIGILREAGFSLEVAAYGWDTIASFVTGFVLQEQSAPFGPGSIPEEPERLAEIVNPERFPNLSEWLSLGPHDPDGYFDAKLGLIIGGLRAELP